MRELLLGLDLGTTSCKAAVVTPDGEEIAHGQAPLAWTTVPTGAEIAPQSFLDCALAAARQALADVPGDRIAGLGVSSMAETGVLLGRDGEPVVPSIAWYDSRGEDEARRIDEELPDFSATTGLSARALRTVAKYRWLRDHVPESERGVRWLSVGEWVVHRLGGEQGAELSLASRTGWLDLHARGWWDEALAWSGAPAGLLPEPAFAGTPLGRAGDALPARARRGARRRRPRPPERRGRRGRGRRGRRARLVGHRRGVRARGRAARPRAGGAGGRDEIMVGWHAVPDRQNLLGAMRSGAALGRVLALLGVGPDGRDALERAALEVDAEAGHRAVGPERLPRGLVNIGADPSPALVWRAALESAGRSGPTCSTGWRASPARTRGS